MSGPKTVIHLFHDDADSLRTGARVASRIREVSDDHGIDVEVFCFGPAQRQLTVRHGEAASAFNAQIDQLIADGVRVGACINSARADGMEDELESRGLVLSVARDEFVRFTLEGATVVTF